LHSWGIDPKLVSCENVPIEFKLASGNQYKIEASRNSINPENIVDSAGRSEIRNILNKFFPPKATITSEEIRNHVNTIKQ